MVEGLKRGDIKMRDGVKVPEFIKKIDFSKDNEDLFEADRFIKKENDKFGRKVEYAEGGGPYEELYAIKIKDGKMIVDTDRLQECFSHLPFAVPSYSEGDRAGFATFEYDPEANSGKFKTIHYEYKTDNAGNVIKDKDGGKEILDTREEDDLARDEDMKEFFEWIDNLHKKKLEIDAELEGNK